MIRYCEGDLFADGAEAYVNAVNCVGVMGGGIARQFRIRYPDYNDDYERACGAGEVQLGRMHVYRQPEGAAPKYLVSFPTMRRPGEACDARDIETGLEDLRTVIRKEGMGSIAIPALGCGVGGLDWETVKPMIAKALQELDGCAVSVYQPMGR